MRFVYPWLLLLVSLVPLLGALWLWIFRSSLRRLAALIAPTMQAKLAPPMRTRLFYAQFILVVAGLALLTIAAARPQWGRRDEKIMTKGRNLVIALDVSRSMLAADVHPNRLERARTDIMDLIDDLQGDRAALLAFRNKGALICPLTTDYSFLRQTLDGASPESAPRGETNLGDAIRKSLEALDPALDEYNAIIMISDGEDLHGGALEAAREAGKRSIPIFTVGIGDTAGATIPNPQGEGAQQFKGEVVKTRLTAETLTAIANASNGRYIPLGTAGTAHTTLGAIYRRHLRQLAMREQQEMIENRYQERYQLFLLPAILCLLASAMLSRGRLRGASRRALSATTTMVLCALHVCADTNVASNRNASTTTEPSLEATASERAPRATIARGRAGAREAQALLRKGAYAEAAAAFLGAAHGVEREEANQYQFNAAYAYYRDGDITNALQTLRTLVGTGKTGARAGELLGRIQIENASRSEAEDPAVRAEALEEAATALQRTLRQTPLDERSNRNLTRAVDPLPTARENAHIAQVLKEHAQSSPDGLLSRMLRGQRDLITGASALFTNEAPALIKQAESLAGQQQELADLWIPLKQEILQAVTNQQEQAMLNQQIEVIRDTMKGTAMGLEDLLPESAEETLKLEPMVKDFWLMAAMPPALLDEDIQCQSNAVHSLELPYYQQRDTQQEALELTTLFRQRFPEWAKQYAQQAQADTNMPPFTAEDQAKVEELSEYAERLQKEVTSNKASADEKRRLQEEALKTLVEIRELLPRKPSQSQQSQEQEQQREQEQEQEQNQQPQEKEEEKEEEEEEKEREPKPELPQDAQEILRRALEREKEHERDKKERMRTLPLSPTERDW